MIGGGGGGGSRCFFFIIIYFIVKDTACGVNYKRKLYKINKIIIGLDFVFNQEIEI